MAGTLQRKRHRPTDGNPLGVRPAAAGTLLGFAWEYLEEQRVLQRTPAAVLHKAKSLKVFFRWADERGLSRPQEVTRPMLERYQRHLFYFRKGNGKPLSVRTQHAHLCVLRLYFRWLMRGGHLDANPASELLLPRLPRRLPVAVLSAEEAEAVLAQPDVAKPDGLRDRAMLELLYSTGLRRSELSSLKLFDVDASRGTVWVRLGKGRKDRVVPVGERALAWVQKYVDEVRPKFALARDDGFLFIGDAGEYLVPDYFSQLVRHYLEAAGIEKPGSCHLFRHTMATAMLDGGADVRFVQEMLGHVSLATTQIYTHVSIEKLKAVHAATHPAARLVRSTAGTATSDAEKLALLEQLETDAGDELES
ncbi:MAG: site-specific tyrosine recombinase XerC [Myxococcaceae bacterium]|nr:site-specific tyrosine recombinase XerC [Myxococcaceae bacterium]